MTDSQTIDVTFHLKVLVFAELSVAQMITQ